MGIMDKNSKGVAMAKAAKNIGDKLSGAVVGAIAGEEAAAKMQAASDKVGNAVNAAASKAAGAVVGAVAGEEAGAKVSGAVNAFSPENLNGDKKDAKADAKPEAKADAKPEAKADAKPEAKADAKPEAKADAKPEAKADAKPEAKADAKPEAKADAKPEAKADAKPEAKADAKPEAKADAKPEAKADAKPEAKADAKPADQAAPAAAPAAQKPAAPVVDKKVAEELKLFAEKCAKIFKEIKKDIIGQTEVVQYTIIAIIAGGNVLLEGAPGLGKTRLVRSLGQVFDLPFSRIQFTPDLMPADVTGTNIITRDENGNSKFEFQKGPIFSNIVLADEINRATPKTQAALLEAMQEHKVTVMGESRKLDEPFFVLATQNPIEQDGTYPLPEAQMDRFMFKILVPNPSAEELGQIVTMTQKTMDETASAACNGEELLRMRAVAKTIPIAKEVLDYAMVMIAATHASSEVSTPTSRRFIREGASPRAAQALVTAAKVRALIKGRYNVSYDDINSLAVPVLRHRIKLGFEAVTSKMSADDVVISHVRDLIRSGRGPATLANSSALAAKKPAQDAKKK